MRKLALSDEILLGVDKAARYIGGEVNSVMKNLDGIDVRVAFCFPDVYEIGMSNLGMMLLYNMFNKRPDVWCERVYSPWLDLDKLMREQNIPLLPWSPRILSGILIFCASHLDMKCVILTYSRHWIFPRFH